MNEKILELLCTLHLLVSSISSGTYPLQGNKLFCQTCNQMQCWNKTVYFSVVSTAYFDENKIDECSFYFSC